MADRQNRPITDDTGTPPPAVPIDRMSDAEYRRLINHFLWLVIDEAEPLRNFGQAELEHVGGRQIAWGPWPQPDCAAVLLRWLEAGYLALYNAAGALPAQEARSLLAASAPWHDLFSHPSEPYVGATDTGAQKADEDWFNVVRDLRRRG